VRDWLGQHGCALLTANTRSATAVTRLICCARISFVGLSLRGKRSSATLAIEFHALRRSAATALPVASRLLLVVRLSSERARQAVRQDCSLAKKQESPTTLLVVVRSDSARSRWRRLRPSDSRSGYAPFEDRVLVRGGVGSMRLAC
jgi:hypothetical protein